MADLASIGRELLTLEINTIVSDGITAERMPTDGQALIRIAQLYKSFLSDVIAEVIDAQGMIGTLPIVRLGDGTVAPFLDWDVASGGMRTFAALHAAARTCREARSTAPQPNTMHPEHDAVLARVAGACLDIQTLLRRMKLGSAVITTDTVELAEDEGITWPAFDHDTLLQLRRIWETGVDVVVMQTIVRLDGGVVTRVLDGWDVPTAAPLQEIHYRAVDISLQRWGLLVQTARDLAGFFLGGLLGAESVQSGGTAAPAGQALASAAPDGWPPPPGPGLSVDAPAR